MNESQVAPRHLASGKSAEAEDFILTRRHKLARLLMPEVGGTLLDFGCGNGAQTFLFAPDFDSIIGVDISEQYLDMFKQEAGRKGISDRTQAIHNDGSNLPLESSSIDCAISFEVLEHVESEDDVLKELLRVIRPGGVLVLSVPNRWWVFETHGASLPLLPWNRVPFFSWLPTCIHDRYARARIYRKSEIIRKLMQFNFTVLHAAYITAPMDVIKWRPLQKALRATFFKNDQTKLPFLATAIMLVSRRKQ